VIGVRLATLRALGLKNILRVGLYRLLLRAGIHPVQHLRGRAIPSGDYFSVAQFEPPPYTSDLNDSLLLFGWHILRDDAPPDWHCNPFTGSRVANALRPWWTIGDFESGVGDIKTVWEASRLDWVVHFAIRARCGECGAIQTMNAWLRDWNVNNPAYLGANWKCGQETSIRVLHLATAALVLGQDGAIRGPLAAMIENHLARISPTAAYAIGQDNNHGTSEAAALMIGGSWLESVGVSRGAAWTTLGRALLEERTNRLIGDDGSFSQYSVNYHRLVLDTLTLAEVWRRKLRLDPLDSRVRDRAIAATRWLHSMTAPESGGAPNIGANDGANLLQISRSSYRDYRPAVHLASSVWLKEQAYSAPGAWHAVPAILGMTEGEHTVPPAVSARFDTGGYLVLRSSSAAACAVMRYPMYRFRPSHADPLHLDLWVNGENCLRDGGTYSYAAEARWLDYFSGIESHNSVQFDARQPMPRLSRFLWGAWLRVGAVRSVVVRGDGSSAGAGYTDARGATHIRDVDLRDGAMVVVDQVSGFSLRAVLRWRLSPGTWEIDGQTLRNGAQMITVRADVPSTRLEVVEGWESTHYLQKNTIPVLEFEVARAGTITTEYRWAS
jgi:Heparinase II/III-like protein